MVRDIWGSFRDLPLWVQIWVAVILVPVNLMPLAFVGQPFGWWVAGLSVMGMMPNIPIMVAARGMSRAMALPHLVFWVPLVALVAYLLLGGAELTAGYATALTILLVVDLISLAFDFRDAALWYKHDRA